MHIDSAFPSKYLKQADLNGRAVRVTIDRVEIEDVGDGDRKAVIYFQDKEKGLALNRINADTISSSYGQETDDWTGRLIELYADPNVYYGGKKVGGLRVRVPRITTAPVVDHRPPPQHAPAPATQGWTDRSPPPPDDSDIPF